MGICGRHSASELPSLCACVPHPAPAPRPAHLHRPALPRYVPRSERGEEKQSGGAVRVATGGGMAAPQGSPFTPTVPGTWCPWLEWTACSQPCWDQTRTRSRACSCLAPQHGGGASPRLAGEAGAQHQRETCVRPPECPGETSHWGASIPGGWDLLGLPRQRGAFVFLPQWTKLGARGDHGLPVTYAWESPVTAEHVAGLPPLREAGPALGATGRVNPARAIPLSAQVKTSLEMVGGGGL